MAKCLIIINFGCHFSIKTEKKNISLNNNIAAISLCNKLGNNHLGYFEMFVLIKI